MTRGPAVEPLDRRAETIPASAPTNEHELELLRRTTSRDRDAFQQLYLIYHRRLARFLTRMTRRYEVAEEVINDTMWIVWQRAGDFRGSSQVSTWIMGIAYRRALKSLRRASLQIHAADLDTRDEETDAGAAVDDAERRQLVGWALARLPLEQRLVLELTYYLGHSCEEIAEIMDCPVNTVKTRMFHARRKLRQLLPAQPGHSVE
ncbi:MAG: sigma-70 family RNA polymerase sigma factor [Gammaproteobacteria bacterium]|nr:sigma-70 family RNA polymerase sigma factor [Gammaproteobacteria bacterium]